MKEPEITEWIEVNGTRIGFYYSELDGRWISTFFKVGDTTIEEFYVPAHQDRFPDKIVKYTQYLFDNFDYFKTVSLEALPYLAQKGQWFGVNDELDLEFLWVELCPSTYRNSYIDLDLYFYDGVTDVYGNWVSKFRNTHLRGIERKDT